MKRKKTTAAELPEELIKDEILTRLPIKDVVRLKSVSKSWLSLLSDNQFVQDHLTRCFTQNPNDYDCLVARKHHRIIIISRYKETLSLPCDHFYLIGSVRGLVCLRSGHDLLLWNPAIRQCKEITLPSQCSRNCQIGFGFDRLSNDYKIVVLSRDLRSATVCYSSSESWIDISVPDFVYLKKRICCCVVVKDCPYWTFSRVVLFTGVFFNAVKFDYGSNEFKLLPEFYFDVRACGQNYSFCSEFVDMNDCLTLIVYDRHSSNSVVDIYSLVGEEGCCVWSKIYSIGPIDFPTGKWNVSLSQGFKFGGEIVFHDGNMFSCYHHETQTIKPIVSTTTSATHSAVSCFRYTPSLVFLEGMKSDHLKTQPRHTPGLNYRIPRRIIRKQ